MPPKLEIDLFLAFEDMAREIDGALIVGVKIKYFRPNQSGRLNAHFYEGLQQALAYALFGFDGIALWHGFHSDLSEEAVRSYSRLVAR